MNQNQPRTREEQQKYELFADTLAETGNLAEAGRAIGVGRHAARSRFNKMCRALGRQAR